MTKQALTFWGIALMVYVIVLVYRGYQYGDGDQSQILPCLYAQDHPGTYPHDHYVNSYLHSGINERTVFHFLFRYLGYQYPLAVFIWHSLISVALMAAWLKIAALGIRTIVFQCVAVILIFTLGTHIWAGGNELYYNSLIPSVAAKALASWAFYFWLTEKYKRWAWLLIAAGLLQPLVGVQVFMLTSLAMLGYGLWKKKAHELPWKWMGIYVLVTIPWIYLLATNNGAVAAPDQFMDIMEFRLAHHFFPSSFGWFNLFLVGVFAIAAFFSYKERMRLLVLLLVSGCLLYALGVEHYRSPLVLYTQWWKTTIWLEALAFIMIAFALEKLTFWPNVVFRYPVLLPVLILVIVGVYRLSGWFGDKPPYMLPGLAYKSDAVDVSLMAKERTPDDAVFIVPVDFTAFRWYAKRSLYVDYKALFHQEAFLKEWYDRIGNIYAYSLTEKQGGFDIRVFSKELLEDPTLISTDYWKQLGVTHIISTSDKITSLQKIYGNKTYSIYKLP